MFNRCHFLNGLNYGGATALTAAIAVNAGANGTILVNGCSKLNTTDWTAADTALVKLANMASTSGDTGGEYASSSSYEPHGGAADGGEAENADGTANHAPLVEGGGFAGFGRGGSHDSAEEIAEDAAVFSGAIGSTLLRNGVTGNHIGHGLNFYQLAPHDDRFSDNPRSAVFGFEFNANNQSTENIAELLIAKHRHGMVGDIEIGWEGSKKLFYDKEQDFEPRPLSKITRPNEDDFNVF
jgi:hypothetical protein